MKMNINVKTTKHFPRVQNAVISDLASALEMVAEEIMTDAKQNYVPVLTGNLRRSGFVNPSVVSGTRVTVSLGFGGAAAPYALKIHEAPKSWGQGRNKYLSKAINASAPHIASRVAVYTRQRMLRRTMP